MHGRSKSAFSRLRRYTQIRTVATATKAAPRPLGKWEPQKPSTTSSNSLSPNLSKWARPRDHNPSLPPADLSSPTPSPTVSKWNPANLSSHLSPSSKRDSTSHWERPSSSSSSRIPSINDWERPVQSKWAPVPAGPRKLVRDRSIPQQMQSGRDRDPRTTSSNGPTHTERETAPHLDMAPRPADSRRVSSTSRLPKDSIARGTSQQTNTPQDYQPSPLFVTDDFSDDFPEAHGKRVKKIYKERGSLAEKLASNEEAIIPAHRRVDAGAQQVKAKKKKRVTQAKRIKRDIFIPTVVSVGNFARLLGALYRERCLGLEWEKSHPMIMAFLTSDYAALLAEEFNRNPVINDAAAFDIYPSPPHPDPSTLPLRPPIVTIMGHVDHGKTTLLDTLRSSSVAAGEAGGITQHIGAFSVPVPASAGGDGSRTITFLDTPGHAAFSAMRARGAGVTDIVVLVVAADDGVMPQTKEVIDLVQKEQGKVQLVVAMNKVDKPGINIENVQNALLVEGVQLEAIGGDIPSVEVSGMTGKGLDQLVETISVVAEMQDLRAERDCNAHGHVLESKVQKGMGSVATVLLNRGCLKPGAHIICGTSYAKVRVMTDSAGCQVKAAYPGMAVTVSGWKELPDAGDEVLQGTEQDVRKAVANRERKAEQETTLVDLEAINVQRRLDREQRELEVEAEEAGKQLPSEVSSDSAGPQELKLIIKGDVSGSVEAVAGAVQGIGNDKVRVKIVSTGVGEVSESDVLRAKAAQGLIVAFSVPVPKVASAAARSNNVDIYSSSIIYQVMDEVQKRVIDLLPSEVDRRVKGEATVLQLFDIHLSGKRVKKVAGSRITNGVMDKAKSAQVVRNGKVVHDGRLDTLRHLKKDITQAAKGMECGISFEGFEGLREGDLIQVYDLVEKPKSL
ncbi:hypothetical protein EW146_g967 [Bondarzewia mesenterica]|uniref:Translation initiation factor IF-2, mitochondrial n=1 Tax=Bondarzewia mesenterica TaxID=1095465 RepID=A0A4S4M594_9AGAM|nr:hypothetical protein EW146_g967 [Bondarzewia mesenterica]